MTTTEARTRRRALGGLARRTTEAAAAHPLIAVGVMALTSRTVVAVASFLLHDGHLIPDEGQYIELAEFVADGRGAEAWFPGYGQSLYDTTLVFTGAIALLFDLLWPSRLVGQLWSVAFGVVAAVLAARLALEVVDRRWALVAGLVVALMPSQVLWSSVVLRESMIWASLVTIALAVAVAGRASGRSLVVAMVTAAIGLLALAFLREQTLLAAAWALVPAVFLGGGRRRAARVAAAATIAVIVPLAAGLGPGGWNLVEDAVPALATTRAYLGLGADSSFTDTSVFTGDATPAAPGDGGSGAESIAGRRPPTARDEEGRTVRLIEGQEGDVYAVEESLSANLSHLPRGAAATLLRPLPWEAATSTGVRVARVENALWYILYALAAVGLVVGRDRRRTLAFPVLVTAAILAIAFLTQGNVGTAFRHRGQVLWAVAVLAAVGAGWTVDRVRSGGGRATPGA